MTVKTNIFSARAECPRDMIELLNKELWFKNLTWKQMDETGADIVIEFETNATLEQLQEELSTIVDTHVLMETLRQCPLKDNPLTRDREVHNKLIKLNRVVKETPLNPIVEFVNAQIEARKLAKSKAVEYNHNLKQLNNSQLVARHSAYLKAGTRNKRY